MKIAVTGSEGFIGKRVLAACGAHTVERFDRVGVSPTELTAQPINLSGCDAVIHLAAHADVRDNWTPGGLRAIERDNITATLRVLDAALESGTVQTFVFISTGAVYASHEEFVDADTVCVATSPYAASKLAGEAYLQAYAHKCGWRYCILRPAACVGKGYHHGHIADFVRQMDRNGRIAALDDGKIERPMVHVDDVAMACVKFCEGSGGSGIHNVNGGMWSWRRTVEIMAEMSGKPVPFTPGERRSGWIGDGNGARWKVNAPTKIANGVREALNGLGWPL